MATAAKTKAKDSTPNLPAVMSDDAFTAALRSAGFIPERGGSEINRLTVKGTNIWAGDDMIASYNQMKREPALIVRLTGEPRQYQALYFSKADAADDPQSNAGLAEAIGRPAIAGHFCKSHFDDPTEKREYAEDGSSCRECPVHPFVPKKDLPPEAKGKRCAWRADVDLEILTKQEDGTYAASDGVIYTMSLATTSVIEFFGSASKGLEGSVSPMHTMARIAKLGMEKWGPEGIQKAKSYLVLGGVICAIHILPTENKELGRSWNVTSFDPIEIIEVDEQPALETKAANDDVSTDDIPF